MSIRKRFLTVVFLFLKIVLDFRKEFILTRQKGYRQAQLLMRPVHEKRAHQLHAAAIELGGVLIKLCQFFSSRRDIFPEPYIKILSSLQDDVPPLPFEQIEKVLIAEYTDYEVFFKSIEKTPLASASLGQVHRAELHTGETVVLKVLKPGIEEVIDRDFAILDFTIRLLTGIGAISSTIDLKSVLREFIAVTGDELNFRREIHIQREFRRHFAKFPYVRVPAPYEAFCTGRVIVMEYLEGDKINEVAAWRARGNDPAVVARHLIALYLEQTLELRLIHYDPHPGNILVAGNNTLVLLDFGMAGEITEQMRQGLFDGFQAFTRKDHRAFIDVLDSLGFIRPGVNKYSLIPVVEFFFTQVFEFIKLDRESIQSVDLSPIFSELVDIIYTQPFSIPVSWAFIGKTVGVISGVIATINPEFRIYEELKPHAERLFRENVISVVRDTFREAKENITTLLRLPVRVSAFMENLERGYYKIQVDYSEIHEKIDEVKEFIIRLVSFIISSVSVIAAFFSWKFHYRDFLFLFLGTALVSFLVALFYHRRTRREKLKKYF